MKTKHFLIILSFGLLVFNCKKEDLNESPIHISSPKDSSIISGYDTIPIIFSVNQKLDVVRTECYVDFNLSQSFDGVPTEIAFNANNYEIGSTHDYYLRVITKDGNTYNSNIITIVIRNLSKPLVVPNFISKNSVKLTWVDNSDIEQGYSVKRKEGSNDYVIIGDLTKNTTSFTDNNIDTTKSYTYEVEIYTSTVKLVSNPLCIEYVSNKYISYKNFIVPEASSGKIAISPDAKVAVITNYANDNFSVINLNTETITSLPFSGGTLGLVMSHNGNFFVTGSTHNNDMLKIWDLNTLSLIRQISAGIATYELSVNKTDERLVVGGEPIKIYNISDGNLILNFNIGNAFTRASKYSNDETLLLTGGNDNLVKLWNVTTGVLVKSFSGHTGHVGAVSFNLDESQIISGSYEDNTILFWNASTGDLVNTIYLNYPVVSICSINNGQFAVSTSNGTIMIMTQDGQTVQVFGDSSTLLSVDYNASKDILASYLINNVKLYKKIGHWESLE